MEYGEMNGTEYNMDHKNELLVVDFRASLQSDIQKALEEQGQCKQVIMTPGLGLNPYLHDAYCLATTKLQSLLRDWNKWFPGEPAIKVVATVPEVFP
jgi:hypothetical protein